MMVLRSTGRSVNEAIVVGDLAVGVGDLDRKPVDEHGVLAIAERQVT